MTSPSSILTNDVVFAQAGTERAGIHVDDGICVALAEIAQLSDEDHVRLYLGGLTFGLRTTPRGSVIVAFKTNQQKSRSLRNKLDRLERYLNARSVEAS